jgi:hypothetical protein
MDKRQTEIARVLANYAFNKQRITYTQLAREIGWHHPTGRGLGKDLGEILLFCKDRSLPALTCIVVAAGTKLPTDDAIKYISKIVGPIDLMEEQDRIFAFDWTQVYELGFAVSADPEIDFDRIFASRVYGFDPENWGMLGFTAEITRDRRLAQMGVKPIYVVYFCSPNSEVIEGSGGRGTIAEEDVGRTLGIAEVQPVSASVETHLSQKARDDMIDLWGEWRWQYGLAISRAWRFIPPPWTREALPNARSLSWEVTKDVVPLTDEEKRLIMQYSLVETNVLGHELRPVQVALREPMHTTYLAICEERNVLTKAEAPRNTKLVKIGVSGDTGRRLEELNGHHYAVIFGVRFRMYATKRWNSQSEALAREAAALEWALENAEKHASGEYFFMTDEQINRAVMKVRSPLVVR